MKKNFLIFISLLFLCVVAACGTEQKQEESAKNIVVTDDNGREVAFNQKPQKIIVTSASFIEPLYTVGGEVIGRPDSKMQIPEAAKSAKVIGKVYQVDAEAVLSLSPDLVILNKGKNERLIDTLENSGVKAIVVEMKTYDDVKRTLKNFAKLTGETKKAEDLIAQMDSEINSVKSQMPQNPPKIAILHGTSQNVTLELNSSIAGSIAQMLNLTNVAEGMESLSNDPSAAPYSLETLAEKNPDIIFVTTMGKEKAIRDSMLKSMEENPAWNSIEAVKNKKVYFLSQEHFLFSPGIHFADAVKKMAEYIK